MLRSVSGLSQVSVSFLSYFIVQTEPEILSLVRLGLNLGPMYLSTVGTGDGRLELGLDNKLFQLLKFPPVIPLFPLR